MGVEGGGLGEKCVPGDVVAGKGDVLEAIRIGFPGLYKKLTGADACLETVADLPPLETIQNDIVIRWDAGHNCYCCTVNGFDFVGYGNNPAGALSVGLWWYRGAETIRRLKVLPNIREERVGW